jgi:REP element-mobilizing transposase RayT
MEDVTLNAQERQIVKVGIPSWHETRWFVHGLTVMPDHAHVLATPLDESLRRHYSLSGILKSVKGRSSREVNRLRGRRGTLWQEESPDRIVRDEREFHAKFEYILSNAVKEGLVADGYEYDGFWCAGMPLPEGLPQHSSAARRADLIPAGPLIKRRRRLPHWQFAGSTYFITFRLRPKVTTQGGEAEAGWVGDRGRTEVRPTE